MRERKTILVSHRVFPQTVAALSKIGNVLVPKHAERFTPHQLARLVVNADAMLAFMPDSIQDEWLTRAPRLRMIAGALKGYDNFDLDACARHGVWVSNVPDLLTIPTAELAIGLMIALARKLRAGDAEVRRCGTPRWRPAFYATGIAGRTVGFIGFGMIGAAIAERLLAFGPRLLYFDRRIAAAELRERLHLQRCGLERLLIQSDFLIVAAPLNPDTYHLLDENAFARCKRGALLINPARGSVVDEIAVARALADGRLGGYAADVFECEDLSVPQRPQRIPAELISESATFFTPHLGSAVSDVRLAIEQRAVANIADWARGRIPRDAVNSPAK